MTRVLVCGSRTFVDQKAAFDLLDEVHRKHNITLVIEGGARGGDRLGRDWANSRSIPVRTVNAQWDVHGKSAGLIRNRQMVDMLTTNDVCVALWDGQSRGTANTMQLCYMKQVKVYMPSGTGGS